jgi:orotidine-5'-phosphate decarboxylase
MNYLSYLEASARDRNSIVCVGLDLVTSALPEAYQHPDKFLRYIRQILIHMNENSIGCGAFKPNQGFYAIHGANSGEYLERIIQVTKSEKVPVILDYKRGDIGPSSANYAEEGFKVFNADAVTISPYMGTDSVEPFLKYTAEGKGVYILCRTSNKGAVDFQNQELKDGRFLYEAVADKIIEWSKLYPGTGAVVGATSLEELSRLATRFASHNIPLLIPGVKTQGGSAKEVIAVLREAGYPLYLARINSSSGVTHPWASKKEPAPENYVEVCANEIKTLNEEIGPIF